MPAAFARGADFFGIIEQQPGLNLFVGEVLHKAFIEVAEEKTEAAGVTVVIVTVEVSVGSDKPEPFVMRINRPFIFFIRDSRTNTILFLGRVMNPKN